MEQHARELEALLGERPEAAQARAAAAFDERAAGQSGLVLFGAGNLGRNTLRKLRTLGVSVLAFADNNSRIWGTEFEGVPILSPTEAAKRHGDSAVFVITIWGAGQKQGQADFEKQLAALGCKTVVHAGLLFWKYPDTFLPYLARDLPHKLLQQADAVRAAFALLADERSRQEYVAQVRWRLWLDAEAVNHCDDLQYFPPDLVHLSDVECFVDCGAFDGDTLKVFIEMTQGKFRRYYAFEPDPGNFAKLKAMEIPQFMHGGLHLSEAAVSDKNGWLTFDASGTAAAAASSEGLRVRAVTLDETLQNETPTYLKFDIEGAELDALRGSRQIIARHQPRLAVCAYHLQDHLWKVPLLIHELNDRYRLYLRPHNREAFDLICYALPAKS